MTSMFIVNLRVSQVRAVGWSLSHGSGSSSVGSWAVSTSDKSRKASSRVPWIFSKRAPSHESGEDRTGWHQTRTRLSASVAKKTHQVCRVTSGHGELMLVTVQTSAGLREGVLCRKLRGCLGSKRLEAEMTRKDVGDHRRGP